MSVGSIGSVGAVGAMPPSVTGASPVEGVGGGAATGGVTNPISIGSTDNGGGITNPSQMSTQDFVSLHSANQSSQAGGVGAASGIQSGGMDIQKLLEMMMMMMMLKMMQDMMQQMMQ